MRSTFSVLIIEPSRQVIKPYSFLLAWYSTWIEALTVTSIPSAIESLKAYHPQLVLLSASFPMNEQLDFLECLRVQESQRIIPVIMVVDLTHPISTIPGTRWGGMIGILDSLCSKAECKALLARLLGEDFA